MPTKELLAVLALVITVSAGNAAQAALGSARNSQVLVCGSGIAVHRAVVMFGLAMLRRHLLDTLTELVGRAASPCLPGTDRRPACPPARIVSR